MNDRHQLETLPLKCAIVRWPITRTQLAKFSGLAD
jgi:hypothetical protein